MLWYEFIADLGIIGSLDFVSIGKFGVDAGYAGASYYWDDQAMANFVGYADRVHITFDLPLIGWFLSIGHMGLPNVQNRYEDTFAEYFFSHSDDFRIAGFEGMFFGKYEEQGTSLSQSAGTGDDGWFISTLAQWRLP